LERQNKSVRFFVRLIINFFLKAGCTQMLIEKMGLLRTSLAWKVAIVTGAGQGIGKELARALAWLGAQVIIAEISDAGASVEPHPLQGRYG
jgi:S-adenosylhomocysteine hydrolase